MSGGEGRVLVLTVGTGNVEDLKRSLIAPMLKSVGKGEWDQVVLLPSQISRASADRLTERVDGVAVDVRPLPEGDQENDADACFGHFDAVLGDLIGRDVRPERIVADFTRGTKAMSAALVLAAVRRDIPVLRYVYGEQRDARGLVVSGTERVGEIRTDLATARRRLDLAAGLMRHGDFGAAISILPNPDGSFGALWPSSLRDEAAALRGVARIYAAWDRLDYGGALDALDDLGATHAGLPDEFRPDDGVRGWLKSLDDESERSDMKAYAKWLRALVCDLLANAERRLRDRHFEDALLRAYRILELVGQFRLFDKGYDSGRIPPDDPVVVKFRGKLGKGGSQDFGRDSKGNLTAPRELAARLLKRLGDPLAPELLRFDDRRAARTSHRNHSVLIHGFTAQAPAEEGPLRAVLEDLEKLLVRDDATATGRLALARRLDFGGTP